MSLINMAPYVNILNTQPFTYRTYLSGSFDNRGSFTEGGIDEVLQARGNFQPVNQTDTFVPEGERAENLFTVYTTVRLKTADQITQTRAYEVFFKERWWKVITPRNWIDNGFNKALIINTRSTI